MNSYFAWASKLKAQAPGNRGLPFPFLLRRGAAGRAQHRAVSARRRHCLPVPPRPHAPDRSHLLLRAAGRALLHAAACAPTPPRWRRNGGTGPGRMWSCGAAAGTGVAEAWSSSRLASPIEERELRCRSGSPTPVWSSAGAMRAPAPTRCSDAAFWLPRRIWWSSRPRTRKSSAGDLTLEKEEREDPSEERERIHR